MQIGVRPLYSRVQVREPNSALRLLPPPHRCFLFIVQIQRATYLQIPATRSISLEGP